MPVTHGSTSESSDHAAPLTWRPSRQEVDTARPPEHSVLSAALERRAAEHRTPRTVTAGFDNRLSSIDDRPC